LVLSGLKYETNSESWSRRWLEGCNYLDEIESLQRACESRRMDALRGVGRLKTPSGNNYVAIKRAPSCTKRVNVNGELMKSLCGVWFSRVSCNQYALTNSPA
jgi:hypothetical protein